MRSHHRCHGDYLWPISVYRYLHIQQDEVISELREYAAANPLCQERAEVLATVKYLSALNIFERTVLGTKTRFFKPFMIINIASYIRGANLTSPTHYFGEPPVINYNFYWMLVVQ